MLFLGQRRWRRRRGRGEPVLRLELPRKALALSGPVGNEGLDVLSQSSAELGELSVELKALPVIIASEV